MQIATWNVNSIRTRLEHIKRWLLEYPVDVLCLQETKVIDSDFPKEPLEELGYELYFAGQKSYNGVAILSRSPLEDVQVGFTPVVGDTQLDEQKRVISGSLNGLRIVNLYVPNGQAVGSEKYQYKLLWLSTLEQYLQKLPNIELCLCGDFNIAPEDRDIYNPKGKDKGIMASPAERAALSKILDLGLKDVFRKFTSESGHYSWWDYRQAGFANNRGWRIDQIYLSAGVYEKAISCFIDIEPRRQEQPSDHTPVIVQISH